MTAPAAAARPADGRPFVALQVAGARLLAVASDARLRFSLSEAARRFVCSPERPDVRATVSVSDLSRTFKGGLLFDSGSLWQLWDSDGRPTLRLSSPLFGPAPYKVASFDPDWRTAEIQIHEDYPAYWRSGQIVDPFEYPLDELTIMHWLAAGRGIELHACGLVADARGGWIFCGQSGAGKSTTARLWQSVRPALILSDDRIVLRAEDDGIWMYGTPWHGEAAFASAERARVRGIMFLEKAQRARLVELSPSHAVARLLACAFFPFYRGDALAFQLAFAERLVATVPCATLEFARDPGFMDLLAGL